MNWFGGYLEENFEFFILEISKGRSNLWGSFWIFETENWIFLTDLTGFFNPCWLSYLAGNMIYRVDIILSSNELSKQGF